VDVPPIKVLVTGAYGLIGAIVYNRLQAAPDLYQVYGLARRRRPSARVARTYVHEIPESKLFLVDVSDFQGVRRAVEGSQVVVHLAADANGRSGWESILPSNVEGTYHVFEACRQAGVERVLYASSVQVVFGYRQEETYRPIWEGRYEDVPPEIPLITHTSPTRPMNLYGCSKVWGEALAYEYAVTHGLSCIALRIGWVVDEDEPPRGTAWTTWCSQRDIAQLIEKCIRASKDLRYDCFYGVSENRYRWVDLEHARTVVGYLPQDSAQQVLQADHPSGELEDVA
jgi:nucleoside-diphosphate-sugar epimerase